MLSQYYFVVIFGDSISRISLCARCSKNRNRPSYRGRGGGQRVPGIPKLMVLGLGLSQLWEWIRANRVRYRSAAMTQDKQTAASQKESTGVAEFRACDERLYPSRIMTIQNGYSQWERAAAGCCFYRCTAC